MAQNTKSVSSNNNYVTSQLSQALIDLLVYREIHTISISQLCQKAGVSRSSFYRNFETKEDILTHYIRQSLFHSIQSIDHLTLSQQLEHLFTYFEQERSFYMILNHRNLTYLIKDVLIDKLNPQANDNPTKAYAIAFVSYSLYGWIDTWFKRGMIESAQDMRELFYSQGL